ncbi:MAG TPA: SsrA-binding protein SmpB [Methyloprofundus sp.]|jgi:SsrA-binding protein|uniref:SsrA-binding protein SmpB n=1 Tax=Methyloprofundus sp. TaxID=2020875 RepID=UPI0017D41499|nr:SsrA-binding protein SmpB [Methyloprofundus sp.]MBT3811542.1 SsrA-binding protein SmpB [Gammaproteobacteria bacterium]HIL79577.1 SsrA-binding protein SmpB [Methylococcales bacterium]MBT5221997.1 SsrA-binding protein SmpB [Gammaproteobacteria bacterium]MBT5826185.1 SsrA-binding protein SmpB [Gammaproteobacteria bacterium]MBT6418829.1 SsrA-binding protein SmpB [Gammaproteobacteria bacterium]
MAGKKSKKNKANDNTIAKNRYISHEYFIEERFEAGLVLEGWEVKSMREGKVQLKESYVFVKNGEVWISGMHISALNSASTHITPFATRVRKLLLNRLEINKLIGNVERKGYTLVPTFLYWKNNRVKLEIGLAKGKKLHDKRATEKDRDWQREKARNLKLN